MAALEAQLDFKAAGFFVFRTPLLSFNEFLSWNGKRGPSQESGEYSFERSYTGSVTRLRKRLAGLVSRPEAREAIFIACPDLIGFTESWQANPETKRGRNTERALVRYFTRMTGRPTPFGLFAGFSMGLIGKVTSLTTEGRAEFRRHTRLDFDYLLSLAEEITRSPKLKKHLIYFPNSSLYRAGGRIRYVESSRGTNGRSYQLVAIEETDYLSGTLKLAREGRGAGALAQALVYEDVSLDEAKKYIDLLIDNQILVPDLSPSVTGSDPLGSLIAKLRKHVGTSSVAATLVRARSELARIDRTGLGGDPSRYQSLTHSLEHLPARIDASHFFHVDLVKPAPKAMLGSQVLASITRGVKILHRISSRPEANALARFRVAFSERYEDLEVPLAEALDEESGVGIGAVPAPSPVITGLEFPAPKENRAWDFSQAFLLQRLCQALERGEEEIALGPADIEKMSQKEPLPLPDSFSVIAKVAAASQKALNEGAFHVLLEGVSGPSGATLFGRFCHADKGLREHVSRYLRAEQSSRPDAVFAEIVHLPEGRAGNIITRPRLREFEIPYLGRSGAPPQRQISISDLKVSVRDGHIRLWSTRLGREVIPRLTSAHDYDEPCLGVYRFLCLLQYQGVAAELAWTWGALSDAPYLPRVVCGNLILSPARWNVTRDELQELNCHSAPARFQAIQSWRNRRRIPAIIFLADGNTNFPVDLSNQLSVESFAMLVKGREKATLVELFPAPHQLVVRAPERMFAHHLIIPFIKSGRNIKRSPKSEKEGTGPTTTRRDFTLDRRRTFAPGGEWLYAKLYTGTATADLVLRELVRPLVRVASRRNLVDNWFFVRYGDPDWHLRLRFHGSKGKINTELLPLLHSSIAPLMKSKHIWRFQLDTYEREVERYGGAKGIVLAEKLFQADSEFALTAIEIITRAEDESSSPRWHWAVYGIDRLLTDFGFDLNARSVFIRRARDAYAKEHGLNKKLSDQLNEKFRKERLQLTRLIESRPAVDSTAKSCVKAIRGRSQGVAGLVKKLKYYARKGSLSVSLEDLALSHIHMHVNRLLRSNHREHELVIYDFLTRIYYSRIAQAKSRRSSKA